MWDTVFFTGVIYMLYRRIRSLEERVSRLTKEVFYEDDDVRMDKYERYEEDDVIGSQTVSPRQPSQYSEDETSSSEEDEVTHEVTHEEPEVERMDKEQEQDILNMFALHTGAKYRDAEEYARSLGYTLRNVDAVCDDRYDPFRVNASVRNCVDGEYVVSFDYIG